MHNDATSDSAFTNMHVFFVRVSGHRPLHHNTARDGARSSHTYATCRGGIDVVTRAHNISAAVTKRTNTYDLSVGGTARLRATPLTPPKTPSYVFVFDNSCEIFGLLVSDLLTL